MSSLKINFFPLHFILSVLALIVLVTVFSNDVYVYMSSNIYINGLIIVLFFICMFWIFGVLSYYSRSAKVLSKLLSLNSKSSFNRDRSKEEPRDKMADRKRVAEVSAAVAGTLIDTPVISKAIAFSNKNGRVEINSFDAANILDSVSDSGERVLGLSRFLTSVFTMLGLAGTFIGLLQTIDGVGKALGSLANIQNVDILGFVKLLADPLQGMSVAFSTSLFGLAAALFGNYGNYVAAQSLSVFIHKLKTVLQATAGISSLDPNKIEAKDILIALDDSFNRLYEGLSDRLDVVSESMMSMVKVIARTNERQERVLKVVVDNFASMEEVWTRILHLTQEVAKLPQQVDAILANNRSEFFNYLDSNVVPVFVNIAGGVARNADISTGILGATQGVLGVSEDTNAVSKGILGASSELLGATGSVISGISTTNAIAQDLAGISNAGNEITSGVLSAVADNVAVSRDIAGISNTGNEIASGVLSAVADSVAVSRDIAGITSSGIEVANGLLGAISQTQGQVLQTQMEATGILMQGNELSGQVLSVGQNILGEVNNGNNLTSAVLGELGNANNLANAILGESSNASNILNGLVGEVNNGNNLTSAVLGELGNANNLANAILGESNNTNNILSGLVGEVGNTNALMNAAVGELSNANNLNSSLLEIASTDLQLNSGIASSVDNMANSMNIMSSQLQNVSDNMVGAVQSFSASSEANMQEISALRQSFEVFTSNVNDVIQGFQYTVSSVADASNTVASLEQSVSALNNSFYSVIPTLEQLVGMYDQNAIASFLNSLDGVNQSLGLVSQSIQEGSIQTGEAINSISSLIQEVSALREDFSNQIADVISSVGNNLNVSNAENVAVLEEIKNEIATLNDNNANSVSDSLLSNILNSSESSVALLSDLTQAIQDLSSINSNSNERAIEALLSLRDEASSSNARLDVVAASVDALIAEMLNSRDVAQSILDLVARMNDYNKIN